MRVGVGDRREDGRWQPGRGLRKTLEMLDEVVTLHAGETGESVTEEDLGAVGVDPTRSRTT